jgi:hypothetical protein
MITQKKMFMIEQNGRYRGVKTSWVVIHVMSDDFVDRQAKHADVQLEHFLHDEIFGWRWWLLVALTILTWIVWIVFRDREKQTRLLFGATVVGLLALISDSFGTDLGAWHYIQRVTPTIPSLFPYDLAILPVEYMFIQQFARNSRHFFWWAVAISAFNAFIAEPIFQKMGVYEQRDWNELLSFPLYLLFFHVGSWAARIKTGWKQLY